MSSLVGAAAASIPDPPGKPSGVACAILADGDRAVFVLEGDRHTFSGALREAWEEAFLPGHAPHTVYRVDYVTHTQMFPATVIVDANDVAAAVQTPGGAGNDAASTTLNTGMSLPPAQYGRYILAHMLSKKWFPRCICSQNEASLFIASDGHKDRAAVEAWVAKVDANKIEELVALLEHFSRAIDDAGLSLVEMVMGRIDDKVETVEAAMARENFEEAGAQVSVSGVPQRVGWSKPFTTRSGAVHCTALFVLRTSRETMEAEWSQAYAARRKVCNWFCAHSWYKFVPGLDQGRMTQEKALRETRSGYFLPVSEALSKLDKKNCAVLQQLIATGAVKSMS